MELAQLAVDTTYPGFEDPRSAADWRLKGMANYQQYKGKTAFCDKNGCDVAVTVDPLNDSFEVDGTCPIQDVCAKELWEDRQDSDKAYEKLSKNGIRVTSKHSAGNKCPHIACTYSCGFSIDGVPGSAGECMKE